MSNETQWLEAFREDAWSMFGGWVNTLTGRGDPATDKSAAVAYVPGAPIPVEMARFVFRSNALARSICSALPEWSIRNGFELSLEAEAAEAARIERDVRRTLDELGATEVLLAGATWGRTFGGGIVLVGADDGRMSDEPLDVGSIRSIRFLRAVDRGDVEIKSIYAGPGDMRYGEPETYQVRERIAGAASSPSVWHASRVLRFPGPLTDSETRELLGGWDESILDLVLRDISRHDGMWQSAEAAVEDASQGVWKIQGLAQAAATGLADKIEARFRLADKARSMFGSLLLDADREGFEYVAREFGGVSDLLGQSAVRVAGAAQTPATVLMGQAPAGLNATGESDLEIWYARVGAYQARVVAPRLRRLVRLVFLSADGPTSGTEPDAWGVSMSDARSLTPMQRAELRARQGQIDASMIASGVLLPEEVAINRYTANGWSDATSVDLGWRRELTSAASSALASGAGASTALLARMASLLGGSGPSATPGPEADPVEDPSGASAPNNAPTGAVE